MTANAQVEAFLTQLNDYTNRLAASQEVQTAKITEIAADIDALIAGEGADLSPEVTAKLEAASTSLKSVAEFEEAQSETLTAVAAKNDEPFPDPVEPV